ncbi:MAG: hypothetical protein KDA84_16640 [Planctomycetaceae bacterium]|nr:hypothetical protein [Planctomycetaceae bacterium]
MKYTNILSLSLLAMALAVTGCSEKTKTGDADKDAKTTKTGDEPKEHAHGTGPNGGVVFDLGKYHAEFTVDHPKAECTILILGDDEKTPTPIDAEEFTLTTKETKTEEGQVVPPMTVKMLPQDASDGKASKFVGSDPGIGNVADFEGTVIGEIDGKPAQGEFKE